MFQPQTYFVALMLMFVTMLCWGSWANTVKACPGYRFQLFYWDYVIGLFLGALVWGLTLGSFGSYGSPMFSDLLQADRTHLVYAVAGGAIFNVANLLLVAAIDIAGTCACCWRGLKLCLLTERKSAAAFWRHLAG